METIKKLKESTVAKLKEGNVIVTFNKLNGDKRVMTCTLKEGVIPPATKEDTASQKKVRAISEETHPKLQREGDNLHYDLYVSLPDAILGSSVEIDTVTGKVRLKIEAGVQSGKILRLRGKGIPNINGYNKGDLLVHINVWTPKTLNKEQKSFFEKMRENEHFVPKPEQSDKSFFEKVKDMFS